MHKQFFAEILTEKPSLFQAILSANGSFTTMPCPLPAVLLASLGKSSATEALWASRAMRRRYPPQENTAPSQFWDFSEESRRLALLPASTLTLLGKTFGAVMHAQAIAFSVVRDDVAALKQELGSSLYTYILQRGRYQAGDSMRRFFTQRDPELTVSQRVLCHGLLALEICCSVWPQDLRSYAAQRFHAVLPFLGGKGNLADTPHEDMPAPELLWFSLKKLLLKEVAPQWASYFN